ncbi:DUF2975 domain-containing protein [Roseiconus nitratireducens]|uniref:DUF2975 domain-containing protein n=1 Tax=Roseiconus nitratireducens TaxID=2605748 RepID=A0A5M6DI23_9BACT|nr:DUF2975 domain-containing protein [Roseiconus nitratireducens]KAA5547103.1 DUF2975 domain-containing protein [Roseiconus nitratireducens]
MNRKPFSLSVLKLLVSVWWWGLIVSGIVAGLWIAGTPADQLEWGLVGYASDIDTSALQAEGRDGQSVNVQFDGPARIKLLFPNSTNVGNSHFGPKAMILFFLGLAFAACIYFVKQLRDIVRTIDQNDPFVAENARRMRTIGVLILVFAFVKGIAQLAISGIADSMVTPTGFNLNGRLEFPVGLIAVALAVIVLSEVFRHGSRMREEQSLTI